MSPTLKRKPFAQWLAVLAGGDLKNLRGALAIVKCFRRTWLKQKHQNKTITPLTQENTSFMATTTVAIRNLRNTAQLSWPSFHRASSEVEA
jgi:hypothetical protein